MVITFIYLLYIYAHPKSPKWILTANSYGENDDEASKFRKMGSRMFKQNYLGCFPVFFLILFQKQPVGTHVQVHFTGHDF